eukprot:scaffold104386_cov34-Phaeocystis_antarctica.AAC.1
MADAETMDSLLRVAAAPLRALLSRLRGSEQSEAAAEAEAAALFAAHVRRECGSSTSPCVLDVCACADPYAPEPPYCTYRLRVPASCVAYVPEAQGSCRVRTRPPWHVRCSVCIIDVAVCAGRVFAP